MQTTYFLTTFRSNFGPQLLTLPLADGTIRKNTHKCMNKVYKLKAIITFNNINYP